MVTGSTLRKEHVFRGEDRLSLLQGTILDSLKNHGWELRAWSVFSNHYHFIAESPEMESSLRQVIQRIHSLTAREANRLDDTLGRRVWFQYWDSCITYEKSYYPRLNYVHNNPVKHGLVSDAKLYSYCSASWFQKEAESSFREKVESFKYDQIIVPDDY